MIGSLSEWQAERIERELTESLTKSLTKSLTESLTKSLTKSITKTVRLEVYISIVHALMQSRGFSLDRAMDVLEIPESMRADVMRALS